MAAAAPAPTAAAARAALRQLLRAVDRNVTAVAGNTQWRRAVLELFRRGQQQQQPSQQQQQQQQQHHQQQDDAGRLLLLAREYADLVANVAHHQRLLVEYNLGVDPDARNKEMVAKTAARVGFRLPPSEHSSSSGSGSGGGGGESEAQAGRQQQDAQQMRRAGGGGGGGGEGRG